MTKETGEYAMLRPHNTHSQLCAAVLCFVALIAPVASCIECMTVNKFFFVPSLFWLKKNTHICWCVLYTICCYYNSTSFRRFERGERHKTTTKTAAANKQKSISTDEKPRCCYSCVVVFGKAEILYSTRASYAHGHRVSFGILGMCACFGLGLGRL